MSLRKKIGREYSIEPSESLILNGCLRLLYAWGLQPVRNNTGGFSKSYTSKKTGLTKTHHIRVGKKGSGDILVCGKRGQWVELEVKTHDGEQSDDQIMRQQHIDACNGIYAVVRSVDELEALKGVIL